MFGGGLRVQTPTHKVFGRLGNGLFLDLQNDNFYMLPPCNFFTPKKLTLVHPAHLSRFDVRLKCMMTRLDSTQSHPKNIYESKHQTSKPRYFAG